MILQALWMMAIAMTCLGATGCGSSQEVATGQPALSEVCDGLVTIGPDGHFLLNRNAIAEQNTDRINDCLADLRIPNVRMATDMPNITSVGNQT